MLHLVAAGALAGLTVAGSAPAESSYGARALLAERYEIAETILEQRRRVEPREPSLLLNMAYLYERTGRAPAARELYRSVLAQENIRLDLSNGAVAYSHDLARAKLGGAEMTSR